MMSNDAARAAIHTAVQQGTAQGDLVTGWVCVAESIDEHGGKWLSRLSSGASGDQPLPSWTEQGLLYHTLYGNNNDGEK